MSRMDVLFARPRLFQDWGEEYEERGASWWELFLDLLMVTAATNLAEALKEDFTTNGIVTFCVMFSLFFSGWSFYTFWQTRYSDPSFVHSLILYVYFLGLAIMVTNANGTEFARGFNLGCLIQRAAILVMHGSVWMFVPRARGQTRVDVLIMSSGLIFLIIAWILDDHYLTFWALAGLAENVVGYLYHHIDFCMKRSELVPLHIDHCADRIGDLVMVILGESVVSGISKPSKKSTSDYSVMGLSLLLAYSAGIMYYGVSPSRKMHAFRRSVWHGVVFIVSHYFITCGLLAMGVGIKFVTEAVTESERVTKNQSRLLLWSESIALFFLFIVRLCHFWGRHPGPMDPPKVRRVKYLWWLVAFSIPVLTAIAAECISDSIDPFFLISIAMICIFSLVLLEKAIQHWLVEQGYGSLDTGGDDIGNVVDESENDSHSYGSFN